LVHFLRFGKFYREKSGNPGRGTPTKKWKIKISAAVNDTLEIHMPKVNSFAGGFRQPSASKFYW
jgi:hypothetical protein